MKHQIDALIQLSLLQKIVGLLLPVKVWKGSSAHHAILEIFYFRNQWQLSTEDAVYSDGANYRPLVKAFEKLERNINNQTKILVLGTGLGSAVSILEKKGFQPYFTMVDIDDEIIRLNKEWFFKSREKIAFECEDAQVYLSKTNERFDLVVVDVFIDRIVPDFLTEISFWESCKKCALANGKIIVNYIINSEENWESFINSFQQVLPQNELISFGINRVLIATI